MSKTCIIVLDTDFNIRFFCPEPMARAIAAQPGAEVTQDDDEYLTVYIAENAGVLIDLHA